MTELEKFIDIWFPKTEEWNNIVKFILESGVQLTEEINPKWLSGYTNIGKSCKPHHKDEYFRYMEESLFVLHDCIHQIFTLDVKCSESEYIQRQIYGELFTFYLTEYIIPSYWKENLSYRDQRNSYDMLDLLLNYKPENENIIDYMYYCFMDDSPPINFECDIYYSTVENSFKKYSKMFKEDLENSRKNFKFVPKEVNNYCMVGASSQNHIDFFKAVSKGAIKNIKREFNLELPKEWI